MVVSMTPRNMDQNPDPLPFELLILDLQHNVGRHLLFLGGFMVDKSAHDFSLSEQMYVIMVGQQDRKSFGKKSSTKI